MTILHLLSGPPHSALSQRFSLSPSLHITTLSFQCGARSGEAHVLKAFAKHSTSASGIDSHQPPVVQGLMRICLLLTLIYLSLPLFRRIHHTLGCPLGGTVQLSLHIYIPSEIHCTQMSEIFFLHVNSSCAPFNVHFQMNGAQC